jgi:hypothetical protein
MKIKVLGSEVACGTSTTNGSNFGGATVVRLYNTNAADQLISVEDSSNSLIGTFTLKTGATELVEKTQSDEIFAGSSDVLGVGVAITT